MASASSRIWAVRLASEGTAAQPKDRVGGAAVELRVAAADRASTFQALRTPTLDEAFLALTGHRTTASDRARPGEL